jgi:2-polyprenyl-6-methoxyphenol hydroxylase-like FAD-dependent oxidoreductase
VLLRGARVGIVGASLGGLSLANVLARAGATVCLYERGGLSLSDRGGGLGLDLDLVRNVTGDPNGGPSHVVLTRRHVWARGREWDEPSHHVVTSYGALWRCLRAHSPADSFQFEQAVTEVSDSGDATLLHTADGRSDPFDLVLVAAGVASSLRAGLVGARSYAGYVLWRGLCSVGDVDDARFELSGRFHVANRGAHHFVAYPVPGRHDSDARLLNWGWYHPLPEAALLDLGERVKFGPPHQLERDEDTLQRFARVLAQRGSGFPEWVLHILQRSLAHGVVAPHPVFERPPGVMVGRRVAAAGDLAHLASPITGSGARMAMQDALVLGATLENASSTEAALQAYALSRRHATEAIVQEGHRIGRAFAAQ